MKTKPRFEYLEYTLRNHQAIVAKLNRLPKSQKVISIDCLCAARGGGLLFAVVVENV